MEMEDISQAAAATPASNGGNAGNNHNDNKADSSNETELSSSTAEGGRKSTNRSSSSSDPITATTSVTEATGEEDVELAQLATTWSATTTQQLQQLDNDQGGNRSDGAPTTINDNIEDQPLVTRAPVTSMSSYSSSLAFCNSTPRLAKIMLPLLCIATHVMFYYGQTAPMWKLRAYANVSVWANATGYTARRSFDVVGLDYDQPFQYVEQEDVQTFTYAFAIQHLWEAKGLPSTTLPRIAAVLLIIFSGVWPHLKLIWLNMTWFFGKPVSRTRTLHWLSTLGKWSLADVLVVCVMVGVLHLDWIVKPDDIKAGVVDDMPELLEILNSLYSTNELCDKFLKITCDDQKRLDRVTKCKACRALVNEAFTRPGWTQSTGRAILDGVDTSGGGLATLRVVGMRGIYAFSGAVIISILLSLIIDIFDHRSKVFSQKLSQQEIGRRRLERVMRSTRRGQRDPADDEFEDPLQEPLLLSSNDDSGTSGPSPLEVDFGSEEVSAPRSRINTSLFSCFFIVMGFITTALIFAGIDLDTMERQVSGAGPMLLHDILGVDWQRDYSLRSLMWTTGAAGSWDYLLMGTFALFIVVGPAIRAVLLNSVTVFDRCRVPVGCLAVLINFVGAFCSWEVFAIAIVMVQMLMPSITNTIINNPVCGKISDDGSCLQVEFNILPNSFSTIAVGGFLLIIMSWQVFIRATDYADSATAVPPSSQPARIMPPNHNYQRLQLVGQQTSEDEADPQLEEVVFETNQV